MRKTILYIMLIMLVAVMLLPTAVFADMSAVFSLISDAAEPASPGDEFTVTLHIKGDYQIHGANLSVDYDPASLKVESAEKCDFLKEQAGSKSALVVLDSTELAAKGQVKLGIMFPADAMSGEGDLIKVRFKIKESAAEHQQVILTVYEFTYMPIGETGTPVYFTTENAIIHIKEGSDPSYGYNPGESGTPNPQISDRPHPAIAGSSYKGPLGTEPPVPSNSDEPVTALPAESASPENTGEPVPSALDSPKPDEQSEEEEGNTKSVIKSIIIYTGLGAVAAAAAAVLIVTSRKKHGK